MSLSSLYNTFGSFDCKELNLDQMKQLRQGLKIIDSNDITSVKDGKIFLRLLRVFREAVSESEKLNGENYKSLLESLLSVGEDGLYSNDLRFIFELIQNVDDCDFLDADNCYLDMHFDFNANTITLKYNEIGFSPFNVFAITGIAEAAKNVNEAKNEIGEKGIGFKSVFGVAKKVKIKSGWFSFELHKDNFTIPIESYDNDDFVNGTEMTLFLTEEAQSIYRKIRDRYCTKEALFTKNPLLFLNKLTSLKMYYDSFRKMEFHVSKKPSAKLNTITREDDVTISVDLHDFDSMRAGASDYNETNEIKCTRYIYPVTYSNDVCKSRYGKNSTIGGKNGKSMYLQVLFPTPEYIKTVGNGSLYSFLPTQIALNVPMICHVPFKLDASREFVDPQNKNIWFTESVSYLSELIDYAYNDWCKIVKNDIIHYLPYENQSIIAKNNGKEVCLSEVDAFQGRHLLKFPLFFTINETFKEAKEVYSFPQEEKIKDPGTVAQIIESKKSLFIPPEDVTVRKYGIDVVKDVYDIVLRTALTNEKLTCQALNYLDKTPYKYEEKNIIGEKTFDFTLPQIEEIMRHKKLAEQFKKIMASYIKKNKRPIFDVVNEEFGNIKDVIQSHYELSEVPEHVQNYIKYSGGKIAYANIEKEHFFVTHKALILSKNNPKSSFENFCYEIDSNDTFVIRMQLKKKSTELDKRVEDDTINPEKFLHELQNIRLAIKDTLGVNGYQNYITLIQKSSTDKKRFIQELLQNADDCEYPQNIIPTFILKADKNSIITEYNENGFTKKDIRSITAIGESTKNQLLNQLQIGEKGIGFKSIFAVANEVKISSGDYHFSLSDKMPTVPRATQDSESTTNGTKMEIILKDDADTLSFSEKNILELCLCLRKLKKLRIANNSVYIDDSSNDDRRVITINGKEHSFKKFTHIFEITDQRAIEQKESGGKNISATQKIVCYVPEKKELQTSFLYVGFPTKHKLNIPMIIDAPFELITSREEIKTDFKAWNDIIREQMYKAIMNVMKSLKYDDGINILRFVRIRYELHGNKSAYVNDITDCDYLNGYAYLDTLKSQNIIPTYDKNVFTTLNSGIVYPEVVTYIFDKTSALCDNPGSVINYKINKDTSNEEKERINRVLKALGQKLDDYYTIFSILQKTTGQYITDENFRSLLYDYLLNDIPESYKNDIKGLNIIPVYGQNGGVEYIGWENNKIFIKEDANCSNNYYYILNQSILSKQDCEKILDVNINEMNVEWESLRYNSNLKTILNGEDIQKIYNYLLKEFKNGNLEKYNSLGTLLSMKYRVPLKNRLNEISTGELYLCENPEYFSTNMLKQLIAHKDCEDFAEYLGYKNLSEIYYNDLNYRNPLTADEIEDLNEGDFNNRDEILREFYNDGLLDDNLLEEYGLEYIAMGHSSYEDEYYDFPEDYVTDINRLKKHVNSQLQNPTKIVHEKIERTIQKGQDKSGKRFELKDKDAREGVLYIYEVEDERSKCFCQMCKKVKPKVFIEVNNIQAKPKYFFPKLRLSLCLECSKRFEAHRRDQNKLDSFIEEIQNADVFDEGNIEIQIGDESITFTGTHLAEIQEILKRYPID